MFIVFNCSKLGIKRSSDDFTVDLKQVFDCRKPPVTN